MMRDNPIIKLQDLGQSIWYDNIRRGMLTSGEMKQMIEDGEIVGVTSNPAIFEKAIAGSTDYDEAIDALSKSGVCSTIEALFEALVIEDIQAATDLLLPVYERTGSVDGYVSVEVSPRLAHDTDGTIEEAHRLFRAIQRPNVMIKVPATSAGLPAITRLIADGINVNITLMFSLQDYRNVSEAYIKGLEKRLASGGDISGISSVASFFISRIDSAVDKQLPSDSPLLGKIAVANAKMTYLLFKKIFEGDRFRKLRENGARVQRLLWASTGTKNPMYRDVKYLEELIGPETVNTVPPVTLDAFRDHGEARLRLTEDMKEAENLMAGLKESGVNLDAITRKLQEDGVGSFKSAFDSLMETLSEKREAVLEKREDRQQLSLGRYTDTHSARLKAWTDETVTRRIWRKDGTVWVPDPEEAARTADLTERMDWLTLPEVMSEEVENLQNFSLEVRDAGFSRVVLLGMGGSSLAPEVFMKTFGNRPGYPSLVVLDSTHPDSVDAVLRSGDVGRALFLVSSKSGGTIETLSFYKFFFEAVRGKKEDPGRNFVAITDPGSALEKLAREKRFRRVFSSPPGVGGRYSALTYFGLVPAALIGVDLRRILDSAATMAHACYSCVPVDRNPGLSLGAAMGELALAGRDKITFLASPGLSPFGVWVEQLIAESTGKRGTGILPVADEEPGAPDVYGEDRFFAYLRLAGDENDTLDQMVAGLEKKGHPVARIYLDEKLTIGGEFFRWEMATAAAGAVLGINPFNQPDVEAAKIKARELMAAYRKTGHLPADEPTLHEGNLKIFAGPDKTSPNADDLIARFLKQKGEGDYVALMAYIPRSNRADEILGRIRIHLRNTLKVATTVGYGPRFLHSTGQLHKGGPNRGLFIQITNTPESDLQIPGESYSFGTLIAAQAMGDYQALEERGRRLIRVHMDGDIIAGLEELEGKIGRIV